MALPALTYILNGRTYLAEPLTQGLSGVSLVTQPEDGQVFFRTKWQGEISFVGADFRLFWDLAQQTCCQVVQLNLFRTGLICSPTTPYWQGVFNLSDLEFNVDAGLAKLSLAPRPDDGYQTLLENWEKSINWLKLDAVEPVYNHDKTILYRRGRRLTYLLSGLISLTLVNTGAASLIPVDGLDTISVFLSASLNPVTRKANYLKNALCLQASDAVAPGPLTGPAPSTGFATTATTTLKAVVEDLRELLNLYPYIDPLTGKLRFEHESFFPQLSYDTRTTGLSYPNTNPVWDGKRTVKTDVEALYGLYELSIQPNITIGEGHSQDANPYDLNATSVDFKAATIEFADACVYRLPGETPLKRERTVNQFATDISGAHHFPDTVDKAAWIFLVQSPPHASLLDPTPTAIPLALTEMTNGYVENGNFSASTLLRDFHRHNQPFAEGVMNRQTTFLPGGYRRGMRSVAGVRQLQPLVIPYCCTDDPVGLTQQVDSWLGPDGLVAKATYQVATQQLSLDIVHPGPCQISFDDTPYVPEEPPTDCPPRGEYLRTEQEFQYDPNGPANQGPCGVTTLQIYADGRCGEYQVGTYSGNGC